MATLALPSDHAVDHKAPHEVRRHIRRLTDRAGMGLDALLHQAGNDTVLWAALRLAVQLTGFVAALLAP